MRTNKFSIRAQGKEAEVLLYGEIGGDFGISAKEFREQLQAVGEVETIRCGINSPGGIVFEALAIYQALRTHPARVIISIDGAALSAAGIIAMAGDEIEIAENGFLMLHMPFDLVAGDSDELRKMADLLDKVCGQIVSIFAQRTGQHPEAIRKMMEVETWLDADEAIKMGFADRKTEALAMAACFDPAKYPGIPDSIKNLLNKDSDDMKTNITAIRKACPGASDSFVLAALEKGMSPEEAGRAWELAQQAQIGEADEEDDEDELEDSDKIRNSRRRRTRHGVEPIGNRPARGQARLSGDFDDLVRQEMQLHPHLSRLEAVRLAARRDPQAHVQYLLATNGGKARAMIRDKYCDCV